MDHHVEVIDTLEMQKILFAMSKLNRIPHRAIGNQGLIVSQQGLGAMVMTYGYGKQLQPSEA